MLTHHSNEAYEVTAARAAAGARAKMERIIREGQSSAKAAWDHIFSKPIEDALVRDAAMVFGTDGQRLTVGAPGFEALPVTDHALGQLCGKAGIPPQFARKLLAHESQHARDLLPEIAKTLTRVTSDDTTKSLVRVVDNRVHAVLSDSYKRRDSRPMLEAFAGAAGERGLVPVWGKNTEVKNHFRVMLPQVFEPVPHEVMCFGLEWSTSDFGAGAHVVNMFMMRLWCTNTAIGEKLLRQVHLGAKLDDLTFSEKTYQLEASTAASAMGDIVRAAMAPERVEQFCEVIRVADETKINVDAALKQLREKGKLTKGESEEIGDVFKINDVEMLPPGNTAWRFSNAISWFAHEEDKVRPERRVELEALAGEVLPSTKVVFGGA